MAFQIPSLPQPETSNDSLASNKILLPLFNICGFKRAAGSKAEKMMIRKHITPLETEHDKFGNIYKSVGNSEVIWTAHTDSVTAKGGNQKLVICDNLLMLDSDDAKKGNCLGADDGAGVFLMCEMIKAKIPGLYIFQRAEESGGLGSAFTVKHKQDLLDGKRAVISLDRGACDSIISHQYNGRTASDSFCESLAGALGSNFEVDSTGTFSDSANYSDAIAECSNVSVGYYNQHGPDETLFLPHVLRLRESLLNFDESKLVYDRAPGEDDYDSFGSKVWEESGFQSANYEREHGIYSAHGFNEDLADLVSRHPETAAETLQDLGIDFDDFAHIIESQKRNGRV